MKGGLRQSMSWLHTWCGIAIGWVAFTIFLTGTISVFASEIDAWMQAPPSKFWNSLFPAVDPDYPRISEGGRHFIRMHYALHADLIGIWIVGVVTMGMLVAAVSGVIVHARIFRDFFTFRPGRGQRAWLDAHNVFGVMTLPFMLMIAYTGLVIFYTTYMPFSVHARYGDHERAFRRELQGRPPVTQQGPPAPSVWREEPPPKHPPLYKMPSRFRDSGPAYVQGTMLALHFVDFGGATMHWLYFASGISGTTAIGAGLILFAVKRRRIADPQAPQRRTYSFIERMNVGVIAGGCAAILGFFWSNRLAPIDIENRSSLEIGFYFLAWSACVLHALLRQPSQSWAEQWALCAGLCAGMPILNMLSSDVSLLTSLPHGDWSLAGVDITFIAAAGAFAAMARAARRKQNRTAPTTGVDPVESRAA